MLTKPKLMLPFHIDRGCFESGFFARAFFFVEALAMETRFFNVKPTIAKRVPESDQQEYVTRPATLLQRSDIHNFGRLRDGKDDGKAEAMDLSKRAMYLDFQQ